jgi:uncharacterized protein (DUF885 family)
MVRHAKWSAALSVGVTFWLATGLCQAETVRSDVPADARRTTALADRWLEQIKQRFPVTYLGSGLPTERHDLLEQNAPRDLAAWREFLVGVEKELSQIPEDRLSGRSEWVTWHYLRQGLAQQDAARLCRTELWQVSPLGWLTHLTHLATLQPVETDELRRQALARWRSVPLWVDQEIANLRSGARLGYTASQSAVRGTLAQFDALLAGTPAKSVLMGPATRSDVDAFHVEWTSVVEKQVWPTLTRYRDFLRDEYLPRARTSASLSANVDGIACYRALINANTTVNEDPRKLFDLAVAREKAERDEALRLGRKVFGESVRDWRTLAERVRSDSRYRFTSRAEVADHARATVARAASLIDRMVTSPPSAAMRIEPFAAHLQGSGPGGEYLPGSDSGDRQPVFYFRDDPERQTRGSFETLVFHETLPGHHLQAAVLAQNQRANLHPITRLLWFSGPGEGWATYAETFARELGLYSSEYEYLCALMSSTTPPMVADLGIQVHGWSRERAVAYLAETQPLGDAGRAERLVGTITGNPGLAVAYPLGAMQFEKMRMTAEKQLGKRFDVRELHRVLLEDGRLPFDAMESKVMRWLESPAR